MTPKRDEELLAAHLAGISEAFGTLVARYTDEIYGFVLRFVGNAAAAEDLTQETFLQVHLAAGAFDPQRSFRPWLYTIAANKARDYLRGRGRRAELPLEARAADDEGPLGGQYLEAENVAPDEVADAEQARQTVRELIATMPEHLRLILVLGYYHQLPYAEMAEILDIPVGTVKSRLHSAVMHFAKLWRSRSRASTSEER